MRSGLASRPEQPGGITQRRQACRPRRGAKLPCGRAHSRVLPGVCFVIYAWEWRHRGLERPFGTSAVPLARRGGTDHDSSSAQDLTNAPHSAVPPDFLRALRPLRPAFAVPAVGRDGVGCPPGLRGDRIVFVFCWRPVARGRSCPMKGPDSRQIVRTIRTDWTTAAPRRPFLHAQKGGRGCTRDGLEGSPPDCRAEAPAGAPWASVRFARGSALPRTDRSLRAAPHGGTALWTTVGRIFRPPGGSLRRAQDWPRRATPERDVPGTACPEPVEGSAGPATGGQAPALPGR